MVKKALNQKNKLEIKLATEYTEKEWNNLILKFPDSNYYQSWAYGALNEAMGWEIVRLVALDDKGIVQAAFQGRLRRLGFKAGAITGTGGPVGDINYWSVFFQRETRKLLGLNFLFVRIFPQTKWEKEKENCLEGQKWKKVPYHISSGLTIMMKINHDLDLIKSQLSRNWKRNLKNSINKKLTLKIDENLRTQDLMILFEEMTNRKNIGQIISFDNLDFVLNNPNKHKLLVTCYDEDRNLLAMRIVMIFGNKAFDYLAVSNYKSREVSASYSIVWHIISILKQKGVTEYDLGGIDPVNGRGVYQFKLGLSKNEFKYLGEYDWSNWPLFGKLLSKAWEWRNQLRKR